MCARSWKLCPLSWKLGTLPNNFYARLIVVRWSQNIVIASQKIVPFQGSFARVSENIRAFKNCARVPENCVLIPGKSTRVAENCDRGAEICVLIGNTVRAFLEKCVSQKCVRAFLENVRSPGNSASGLENLRGVQKIVQVVPEIVRALQKIVLTSLE
jgi:hypothetical protein